MEKLEQVKPYEEAMDFLFKDLYEDFKDSEFRKIKNDLTKKYRGIYVFYKNREPIYVGRSNDIKNRISWHTRPGSGSASASFAFNLAKRDFANIGEINITRKALMDIPAFKEIFQNHKFNLSNLEFKCIEIDNDILQTMFEPYLALKLKTYPHNNTFENH